MKRYLYLSITKSLTFRVLVFTFILSFLFQNSAFAQPMWDGGGGDNNWNTPANWDPDAVPNNGDNVDIPSGSIINIVGVAQCNQLNFLAGAGNTSITVGATGTFNVGSHIQYVAGYDQDIVVNDGEMTVGGNVNCNGAAAENTITVNGTGEAYFGGTFTGSEGTLTIDGLGGTTIGWVGDNNYIKSMDYDNLVVRVPATAASQTRTFTTPVTVQGDLTIESYDAAATASLDAGGNNFTVDGTTNIGSRGIFTDSDNGGTNIFTGAVTVAVNGQFLCPSTSPIEFDGGITNNGTFDAAGSGQIDFTSTQTLDGSESIDFGASNINIPGGVTVTNSNTDPTDGVIIDGILGGAGTFDNDGVLTYGNINSPTPLEADTNPNTVKFTANGAMNIPATDYHNLEITGTGTKTLQQNTDLSGNLTLAGPPANAALETGAFSLNVNGNGTSTIDGRLDGGTGGTVQFAATNTLDFGGEFEDGTFDINGPVDIVGTAVIDDAAVDFANAVTIEAGEELDITCVGGDVIAFNGGLTNDGTYDENGGCTIEIQNGLVNNNIFQTTNTSDYYFENTQNIDGTAAIDFAGDVYVQGGETVTNLNDVSVTINGDLINDGANPVWENQTGSTLNLAGTNNFTASGTIDATALNNTVNYTRAGNQTVIEGTYYNLGTSGSGTKTQNGDVDATNLNIGNNTTYDPDNHDLDVSTLTTIVGTFDDTTAGGTSTLNNVDLAGGEISGDSDGDLDITGDVDVSAASTIGNIDIYIDGTTTVQTGVTLTVDGGVGAGTKSFGDVNIENGATWANTNNPSLTFDDANTFADADDDNSITFDCDGTFSGATTMVTLDADVDFRGDVAMTINGPMTIGNTRSFTNNNNISLSITGDVTSAGVATVTNPGGAVLNLGGDFLDGGDTFNANAAGNIVNYNGNVNQDVFATTYYDLECSTGGDKDLQGNTTVLNDITINAGATLDATAADFDIAIGGDWTNNSVNGFNARGAEVDFNGGAVQTIGGAQETDFNDLTTSGAGTNIDLATNATIDGTLTLVEYFTLNDNTLTVTSNNAVGGPLGPGTHVVTNGNGMMRNTSGLAFTFPIGDGTNYSPFSTAGGSPQTEVRVIDGKHPNIDAGSSDYITRYWEMNTNNPVNITATFIPGDVVGDAGEIREAYWTGAAPWNLPDVTGTGLAVGNVISMNNVPSSQITGGDGDPPDLSNISIASDNRNAPLAGFDPARVGNDVIVTFTASETLDPATTVVTIGGHIATLSNSGLNYTARVTMAAGDLEAAVAFSIDHYDMFGNPGTVNPENTTDDGSSVVFDETDPLPAQDPDAAFPADFSCESGDAVTIINTGGLPADFEIWFAPAGSVEDDFDPSRSDMSYQTVAQINGGTQLIAPADGGSYQCYILDYAGNATAASSNTLIVGEVILVDPAGGPGTFPTIQQAIDDSDTDNGDIISIVDGTYYENVDFKGKTLSLRAAAAANVIIDGDGKGSCIKMENLTGANLVQNITLQNGIGTIASVDNDCYGYYGYHGGGLFCDDVNNLTLDNVTIKDNTAVMVDNVGGSGGGLYCNNSTISIKNSSIENNEAELYRGGGICADNSSITFENSNILNNKAGNYGGGIALLRSTLTFNGGTNINFNSVDGENACGGARYEMYSTIVGGPPTENGNTSTDIAPRRYVFDAGGETIP